MTDIPKDHPRYKSLMIRERLVDGFKKGVVVPQGLIAHGRGEAFDYLIGEETIEPVYRAYEASAALLLLSQNPIIAVNGNAAALAYEDIGRFAEKFNIPIEINLFHFSVERVRKIRELFESFNVKIFDVYDVELPTVSSKRRLVSREGIYSSDTVMVMIEDGDMPIGLRKIGKKVIAIDLNPLSRTARDSDITIVDNLVRVFPILTRYMDKLSRHGQDVLRRILEDYDNNEVLKEVLIYIVERLTSPDILD